jgi:glycosyltransferase involved in cell wall biosynthesis
MSELVKHGKNGLLFTPGNAEELANAISVLINNPELANDFGLAAKKYVFEEHGAEIHYSRIIKLYKKVSGS